MWVHSIKYLTDLALQYIPLVCLSTFKFAVDLGVSCSLEIETLTSDSSQSVVAYRCGNIAEDCSFTILQPLVESLQEKKMAAPYNLSYVAGGQPPASGKWNISVL